MCLGEWSECQGKAQVHSSNYTLELTLTLFSAILTMNMRCPWASVQCSSDTQHNCCATCRWVGPVAGITSRHNVYCSYRHVTEQLSTRIRAWDQALQAEGVRDAGVLGTGPSSPPSPAAPSKFGSTTQNKQRREGSPRAGNASSSKPASSRQYAEQQRALLIGRRRALSHELMQRVQGSYSTSDLAGRSLSVLDAYYAHDQLDPTKSRIKCHGADAVPSRPRLEGFPAGTGDCCAPKLLHAAYLRGLKPLSLVEWWYGTKPNTATKQGRSSSGSGPPSMRVHGTVHPSCQKCESILGSMLCMNTEQFV